MGFQKKITVLKTVMTDWQKHTSNYFFQKGDISGYLHVFASYFFVYVLCVLFYMGSPVPISRPNDMALCGMIILTILTSTFGGFP